MSKEEEKIIIPIPAEKQEMYKEVIEAEKKLRDSFIALQNNPNFIKREKGRLALKKIDELKDRYWKQKVGDVKITVDDLLREIENISFSDRSKIDKNNTKVKVDDYGGLTYAQAMKFLDALAMYNKYRAAPNKLKSPQAMQSVLRSKRFPWTLATLKRYLTIARKLPPDPGAVKTRRKKLQNL